MCRNNSRRLFCYIIRKAVNMLRAKMKNEIKCSCYSHALNLSIMKGCKIKFVKITFELIKEVIHFSVFLSKKLYFENTLIFRYPFI